MSDLIDPLAQGGANQREFSVSEISGVLKKTVESGFSNIRVRGEISGLKRAASGHIYFALKDDRAVLDAVCWRGTANGLALQPTDGIEVVISGYMTTYPSRSRYQLVVEDLRLAGVGALLQMLEKLKAKLQGEGLFHPDRKQPIPYLPRCIGVVTSPTGAVIKDILHRLNDRFPSHVLVWPVLVQGKDAAKQIAKAIEGFNNFPGNGHPKPDVIIVARGGGSLEDLWAFNEEIVVRAAAHSSIPLISAVGHETDTTLIDFASDLRAPTPSAAAEMAVPVRAELLAGLSSANMRMRNAITQRIDQCERLQRAIVGRIPLFSRWANAFSQPLDDIQARLQRALANGFSMRSQRLHAMRLIHPKQQLQNRQRALDELAARMHNNAKRNLQLAEQSIARIEMTGLRVRLLARMDRLQEMLTKTHSAIGRNIKDSLVLCENRLDELARLIDNLSHNAVLRRGYALARTKDGNVISHAAQARKLQKFSLSFQDGDIALHTQSPNIAQKPKTPTQKPVGKQQDLF